MALTALELEKALLYNTMNYSLEEKNLLKAALDFAKDRHSGAKRNTGEEYITHPLSVAKYLSERNFDSATVISALLHDVIEDCDVSFNQIDKLFGFEIANIVEGITKISSVPITNKSLFFSPENYFAERVDNYRKLLMSTAKDIRVVIIKLFDRLHNVETIEGLEESKRRFYAIETIEIYAQIAERIGLAEIKRLLEDLSFEYAYPDDYERFQQAMKKIPRINEKFVETRLDELREEFIRQELKFEELQGRIKHNFSIFKKLSASNYDFQNFYDLYAIRVIVHDISDCYKALGIVHSVYTPVSGRIFDSIAEPKPNGYQSLHTTVRVEGKPLEIQIRTVLMHQVAEYGPAAHWHYKEVEYGPKQNLEKSNREWLEELSKLKNISDNKEFLSYLRNDLFAKKIFVLSPKGDIYNLPQGATVIDFAFRVHSNLGEKLYGAKINGEIAEISSRLKNGDTIEILTSNRAKPSIDWLRHCVTSGARQKIKRYLKSIDADKLEAQGVEIFNQIRDRHDLPHLSDKALHDLLSNSRLPYNKLSDLMIALAERAITPNMILKVLYPSHREPEIRKQKSLIKDSEMKILSGIRYDLAKCCQPTADQKIVGYVGRDHNIKVHRKNCKFIKNADPERLIYIDPFDSRP